MSHYRPNLRDLEFVLFEMPGATSAYGQGPYAEVDVDTARQVLAEAARLATGKVAASFAATDRQPPVYDPLTREVAVPEAFAESFRAWRDAGYWRLGLPPELGGTPAPPRLLWALAELVLGANPAVFLYAAAVNFARLIHDKGTAEQQKVARLLVERAWGATMVLTEPDAGSDVGAGRAKAVRQDDGSWHVEGVKRFITSGEHDLAENIVHFVLARPEGAGPGTKGLSLFLVPKYDFDWDTGELGERNGVHATNVEHKMGLKASTTCELVFGGERPAKGWLLGEVHDGIAQMFLIIENARMTVGTKAIATLSTGYLTALEYARTRVQGPDISRMADKTAPRVTIVNHPEVRRSLLTQKAYAEGLRALVAFTAGCQEAAALGDPAAAGLNDLLLPLVKGYGAERSSEQLMHALQVLGGSGYLQDYPLEQYVRDARIDSLYEGTTAIQSMDLFFRKVVRDRGASFGALSNRISGYCGPDADLLKTALEEVQSLLGVMIGHLTAEPPRMHLVGENTTRFLHALGDVVVAWLLLTQAEVAAAALPTAVDKAFYEGKVATARWFARTVLPQVTAHLSAAKATDGLLASVPEDAF
ncbi:acyl-CoA dehydrogenase [Saccharothrix algeriensis]|uniref:Alkylation response protein AidB-like acyl-CoA dehydrogenase n=1 Tax=Saccharothrix algeriensis TaxID=173560 RepID=A0ABS2S342_9PSEU|nr:acyl-CoA dehydrogenase [Saccharothrix algeriensis]MBM7810360.1 alkylation response protein AidB-like acyl-CoA dehydrogenase [Saccharothrix algeriensis]